MIYPEAKSYINVVLLSIHNFYNSQLRFLKETFAFVFNDSKFGVHILRAKIFILPCLIIIFFLKLYSASNPYFHKWFQQIFELIDKALKVLLKDLDFELTFTLIMSMIISNYIFLRTTKQNIISMDTAAKDELIRVKSKPVTHFKISNLKNEFKSAVFLTFSLNLILLILNAIDIYSVWFNFSWNGQYLKEFVHEGTYILIFSIIISILLVLRFFRGNINFYKENMQLKILCYFWLIQNGILAISVGIRNFWYIHFFSLATKRIAVMVFLLLTLYGLNTVFIKVLKRKSMFYVVRQNAYALYILLIFCALFNWDNIIAKYNFENADSSFLHFDYMVTLSNNSLPYIDKPLSELHEIEKNQKIKFPFEQKYMSADEYYKIINARKLNFKTEWESKGFLSWNLAEYMAYKKLFENEN